LRVYVINAAGAFLYKKIRMILCVDNRCQEQMRVLIDIGSVHTETHKRQQQTNDKFRCQKHKIKNPVKHKVGYDLTADHCGKKSNA